MPRFEVRLEAEVALDLVLDAGDVLGLGQLEDGLGVVGHRAIAIDGDVDRAHAEEAERDQAEGEDGADADERLALHELHQHEVVEALQADEVGARHQAGDQHAHPEGTEVARDQAGEDRQRGAAFAGGGDDFMHVLGVRAGEDLGELGNEHRGQGAATDDRGQLPPEMLRHRGSTPGTIRSPMSSQLMRNDVRCTGSPRSR